MLSDRKGQAINYKIRDIPAQGNRCDSESKDKAL